MSPKGEPPKKRQVLDYHPSRISGPQGLDFYSAASLPTPRPHPPATILPLPPRSRVDGGSLKLRHLRH